MYGNVSTWGPRSSMRTLFCRNRPEPGVRRSKLPRKGSCLLVSNQTNPYTELTEATTRHSGAVSLLRQVAMWPRDCRVRNRAKYKMDPSGRLSAISKHHLRFSIFSLLSEPRQETPTKPFSRLICSILSPVFGKFKSDGSHRTYS